jgi:hypothetical protein
MTPELVARLTAEMHYEFDRTAPPDSMTSRLSGLPLMSFGTLNKSIYGQNHGSWLAGPKIFPMSATSSLLTI